jgi:hypothetical protein
MSVTKVDFLSSFTPLLRQFHPNPSSRNVENSDRNVENSNQNVENSDRSFENSDRNVENSDQNVEGSNRNVESPTQDPNDDSSIEVLPNETLEKIFQYLDGRAIFRFSHLMFLAMNYLI